MNVLIGQEIASSMFGFFFIRFLYGLMKKYCGKHLFFTVCYVLIGKIIGYTEMIMVVV